MSDLHVRRFPDEIHHAASVKAAQNKESLRDLVIRAVAKEVDMLDALSQGDAEPGGGG